MKTKILMSYLESVTPREGCAHRNRHQESKWKKLSGNLKSVHP